MQKLFLTIIVIALFGFSSAKDENEAHKPIVVLELFTSQGCSSCPSADVLLDKVKTQYKDSNVFTLSYHVDYWNYIGWKDPFSSKTYTDKQKQYADKFRSGRIYTPQIVVNGREHFVGSNKSKMQSKLRTYLGKSVSNSITLKNVKKTDNNSVAFGYTVNGSIDDKQLRVVLVIDERETFVKRGENRSRTLKNANIVVAESFMALKDKMGEITIQIPETVLESDSLRLITLVEDDNLDITGAAKIKL